MNEKMPEYWPFPVLPPERRSPQHQLEVDFLNESFAAGLRPCRWMDGEYRLESPDGRSAWLLFRGRRSGANHSRWEVWFNNVESRVDTQWFDDFSAATSAVLQWLIHPDDHPLANSSQRSGNRASTIRIAPPT